MHRSEDARHRPSAQSTGLDELVQRVLSSAGQADVEATQRPLEQRMGLLPGHELARFSRDVHCAKALTHVPSKQRTWPLRQPEARRGHEEEQIGRAHV